ncbi:MAG: single-stranded DNA-binding protein [Oscillospiraceae bacterium]|jgi:single-strand DNA-binding protein|nr:single-stranded DNA-binding protein [Oscillospiraceae bacterium]
MNHIILMGRMTRDPELRHTQTGTPVASFTLAVDRQFVSREGGERQTDFIDIVAWRQQAEFVTKYFVKGQLCAVHGRLQIRDWVDKENNKRRNAEVVAENIYFTGDRRNRDTEGGYNSGERYSGTSGGSYSSGGSYGSGDSAAPRPSAPTPARSSDSGSFGFASGAGASGGFSEFEEDDGELPF